MIKKDEEIEILKNNLFCNTRDIESLKQLLNVTRQQLSDVEKYCQDIPKVKDRQVQIDKSVDRVHERLDMVNKNHEIYKSEQLGLTGLYDGIHQKIELLDSKLDRHVDDLNNFKLSSITNILSHERDIQHNFNAHKRVIEDLLVKLRSDLVVSPKDVYAQNEEIIKKVESADVNCSQAMQKMVYVDVKFRQLESRINDILNLLKK